ncbi:nucleotidyltransferase, putative [Plasmodium yoelii]|uniref:Nucleotidyltransferase n=2 Tax=Plasmodium yoelii TaxID=5861 RepID=A0AAE9WU98_PLAYO|nr:nucleotidyltransferase, putative [Plasmodium yoelii]WBY60251.1 nucleotidyltransferase [Plasmodium yoelii yoelii]CDU20139.1 nucleotidyltransferase, putative [Plasmodium yoelii]VTZ80897.1 nucleotidyltransferase, putative [Plasmodium yoelii]|eukprot:XP_022813699.1 nucleotidyltransferase, putative [Plasmodium yoelii]
MDDLYYFLYNEEEPESVKEAKLELHKVLKKNRERPNRVNKPMKEADTVISLVDNPEDINKNIKEKKIINDISNTEQNVQTDHVKKKQKTLSKNKNKNKNTDEATNSQGNVSDISIYSCSSVSSGSDSSSSINYLSNLDKEKSLSSVKNKSKIMFYGNSINNDETFDNNQFNGNNNKRKRDEEQNNLNEPWKEKNSKWRKINNEGNGNENEKDILQYFKINYQKLTSLEQKYYKHMMKKLKIRYDNKKKIFFANDNFTKTFSDVITKNGSDNFNFIGYLEYSFRYLLEWLTPTKEEKLLKLKSVIKLEMIVKSIYPNCKMEIFGSFVTGLSIPSSDIDVCFMDIKQAEIETLTIIGYVLIKLNVCRNMRIIKDAKVKILKYTDNESGANVDICINQKSSKESTDFVKKKIKEYIYLRPLVILIKFFLNSRNLNETYTGGIGSFMLCCMVLHFLQIHPLTFDTKIYNNTNLVSLIIEFFYFYNLDYPLNDKCSVLRGLGHVMPRYMRSEYERNNNRLCIENPIDISIDVGANSYKIRYILHIFSHNFCNLITLIKKLKKQGVPLFRNKYNTTRKGQHDNNFIQGNKLNPNSIFPLFYGNFLNPNNIAFTKRFKNNFPNSLWNIDQFDFAYTQEEKNKLFEMICNDMSSYFLNNFGESMDAVNIFSTIDRAFFFSLDIFSNIFKCV